MSSHSFQHHHWRIHQELSSPSFRSAMVSSMASILDGTGDYHFKSIPLHYAMSISCDSSPAGMCIYTYTTLMPFQSLPPISTMSLPPTTIGGSQTMSVVVST